MISPFRNLVAMVFVLALGACGSQGGGGTRDTEVRRTDNNLDAQPAATGEPDTGVPPSLIGGSDGGATATGGMSASPGTTGPRGTAGSTGLGGVGGAGGTSALGGLVGTGGGGSVSEGGRRASSSGLGGKGGTASGGRGGSGASAGRGGSSAGGSGGKIDAGAGSAPADASAHVVADGGNASCTPGSGTSPSVQTLVLVRHAETLENVCQSECDDDSCCRPELCAQGCDGSCSCDENVLTFSSTGWGQIGDVLVGKLRALRLAWDRILVSPTWRTQTTIKAFLEAESLCGEILPEIDECWSEDSGSCSTPKWSSDDYQAIAFADGAGRLLPRPHNSQWDASATSHRLYEHTNLACETIIMDRGHKYIEDQFAGGAKAVLVVTHSMTGAGLLQRLTGKSSYDLDNASAYTLLNRPGGSGKWTMVKNNAHH